MRNMLFLSLFCCGVAQACPVFKTGVYKWQANGWENSASFMTSEKNGVTLYRINTGATHNWVADGVKYSSSYKGDDGNTYVEESITQCSENSVTSIYSTRGTDSNGKLVYKAEDVRTFKKQNEYEILDTWIVSGTDGNHRDERLYKFLH